MEGFSEDQINEEQNSEGAFSMLTEAERLALFGDDFADSGGASETHTDTTNATNAIKATELQDDHE